MSQKIICRIHKPIHLELYVKLIDTISNYYKDNDDMGQVRVRNHIDGADEIFVEYHKCACGNDVDERYAPCCSSSCWDKKYN